MKIVAIVPVKSKSRRIKNKNFKLVNNKPLYRFILDKLKKCNFDQIYVDSDSETIKRYCKKNNYIFIKRKKNLSKDSANGNDLINYHQKIIDADIYFQIFITSPLLKVSSINRCIEFLKKNKKYDSILTANSLYTWFWFKNKPVNYNPRILPRSQDAKPVIVETTGLYGIRKKALIKYRCRIGAKPFFMEVSKMESLDIDDSIDLKNFKLHAKKNLYSSKR
tara:strand:+ start:3120 stop:3782 length:663 start_codon:yes stop_codon:yes gene_type:complete